MRETRVEMLLLVAVAVILFVCMFVILAVVQPSIPATPTPTPALGPVPHSDWSASPPAGYNRLAPPVKGNYNGDYNRVTIIVVVASGHPTNEQEFVSYIRANPSAAPIMEGLSTP